MVCLNETVKKLSCVRLEGVENFDIGKVFDCGQCFRFDAVGNTSHEIEFSGVAHGKLISVAQDGQTVYIYNSTKEDFENIWKRFLGLDEDYGAIAEDILSRSDNPALGRAVEYVRGIRILRQEPWETICSFIISQNNNIPRIKKIIGALAQKCGEPIGLPEGMECHISSATVPYAFPTPEALCDLGVDGLFELKTGFRAKYIYDAASRAAAGNIDYSYLESADDTAECVRELCEIKGVGPKVASCALLFGFGRYDAFPVDVWIKKVIQKYFSADGEDFSPEALGPYAGIAQQFLFYYERYLA